MTKKKVEKTIEEIALALLDARKAIAEWKEIEKPLADSLKKRIKDGESQNYFKITSASTFKVDNRDKAVEWATKYAPAVITVDSTAARKLFLGDIATGSMGSAEQNGFKFAETERLVAIGGDNYDI